MAKSATLVQVELLSNYVGPKGDKRFSTRVCWVEPKVKRGDVITLKDSEEPERRWEVMRIGEEAPRTSIRTDWHNNI